MMHDFHSRNIREWLSIQSRLFPVGAPQRAVWTGTDEICAVLRVAAELPSLNHLFLPTGGGQDLIKIELAAEPGFISLVGPSLILKPHSLSYEAFEHGSAWNYFRLEAEPVPPTGMPGAYIRPNGLVEELCELRPGKYVPIDVWEEGKYDEAPLPKDARPIKRALKGAFVIFAKRSWYNLDPRTYDARHQRMSGDEFRNYISRAAVKYPGLPPPDM